MNRNDPVSTRERAASWSRYWQHGGLHSCSSSFDGNYSGEVRAFWHNAFAPVANGGRMLDLCTGNGPIARLALELAPDPSTLSIDAVDLANVAPAWWSELAPAVRSRVRFHGGVAAERLPLAAGCIDLAVSQFGLEYTDVPASVAELRRVLAPGARVALLVHAHDSLIVRQALEERGHLQWLDGSSGLGSLGREMLGPASRSGTAAGRESLRHDAGANRLRARFNAAMQQLADRSAGSSCPDLLHEYQQAVAAALATAARTGAIADGGTLLDQLDTAMRDRRLQLDELVDCARSRASAESLLQALPTSGVTVSPVRFANGELLGWGLLATTPG